MAAEVTIPEKMAFPFTLNTVVDNRNNFLGKTKCYRYVKDLKTDHFF